MILTLVIQIVTYVVFEMIDSIVFIVKLIV